MLINEEHRINKFFSTLHSSPNIALFKTSRGCLLRWTSLSDELVIFYRTFYYRMTQSYVIHRTIPDDLFN